MIRLSLIAAFAGLLFCGCGRSDGGAADRAAAEGGGAADQTPPPEAPAGSQEVKTPLIRALIRTVDEAKGESPEVKDSLRRTLREADRDLAEVLGGNSKRLIMKANKKPPMLVVGAPSGPAAKGESGKAGPSEKTRATKPEEAEPKKPSGAAPERPVETTPQEVPADDQKLNSPMVRALIQAVDDAEGEQGEAKKELKRLLRQVDRELSEVLGGNSKRLILKANKKPPVGGGDGSRRVKVRSLKGVKVVEFNPAEPGKPAPEQPEKR